MFFGCIGALFAFMHQFELTALCILISAGFDLFDGAAARALQVTSPLGAQLDAMADLISFGFVPGLVMFQQLQISGLARQQFFFELLGMDLHITLVLWGAVAFLIPISSGLRLAIFVVNEHDKPDFSGVPTPANALLFVGFPLLLGMEQMSGLHGVVGQAIFMIPLILVMVVLMNAPIRLFSIKKYPQLSPTLYYQLALILGALVLIYFFQLAAMSLIIVFYLILNIIRNLG